MNSTQISSVTHSGNNILLEEKGRVIGEVDYNSFTLKLVRDMGFYHLYVIHGAGEEKISLIHVKEQVIKTILNMEPDTRFLTLFAFYDIAKNEFQKGFNEAEVTYQRAAAEGRLKTRKVRGENRVKVWVEDPAPEKEV
jgi:hypothetical protein